MLNLELLFEASKLTNDKRYYEMAVSHANTTMKNHFRADGSSYHVVDYHPESGEVITLGENEHGECETHGWKLS